jgi:hypothetical protein
MEWKELIEKMKYHEYELKDSWADTVPKTGEVRWGATFIKTDGSLITKLLFNPTFKKLQIDSWWEQNERKEEGSTGFYKDELEVIHQVMKHLNW